MALDGRAVQLRRLLHGRGSRLEQSGEAGGGSSERHPRSRAFVTREKPTLGTMGASSSVCAPKPLFRLYLSTSLGSANLRSNLCLENLARDRDATCLHCGAPSGLPAQVLLAQH